MRTWGLSKKDSKALSSSCVVVMARIAKPPFEPTRLPVRCNGSNGSWNESSKRRGRRWFEGRGQGPEQIQQTVHEPDVDYKALGHDVKMLFNELALPVKTELRKSGGASAYEDIFTMIACFNQYLVSVRRGWSTWQHSQNKKNGKISRTQSSKLGTTSYTQHSLEAEDAARERISLGMSFGMPASGFWSWSFCE